MLTLWQLIRDLPQFLLFSLVLTTALPVAGAASDASTELPPPLTPDNFKSTISTGLWFVEHYSPHCHHCIAFMPTWTELHELNEKGEHPGMHMAQVDCAMYGGTHNASFYNNS